MNRSSRVTAIAVAVAVAIAIPAAAPADPSHWTGQDYLNGQPAPASDLPNTQPLGNPCFYLPEGDIYWIMFPGPVVDSYNGALTSQAPSSLAVSPSGDTNAYLTQQLEALGVYSDSGGGRTGPEYVDYVPYVRSGGNYYWSNWMRSLDGYPGDGLQYEFWRRTQSGGYDWQPAQFDTVPPGNIFDTLVAAYGSNWEWDSMTVNSAGSYITGGYLQWERFEGSSFPGLEASFEMDNYTVCDQATRKQLRWSKRHGGAAIDVTGSSVAQPPPAPRSALRAAIHTEVRKAARQGVFRLKTSLGIHSRVRPGHYFGISTWALRKHTHKRVKRGYIECHAKIGKVMIPNKRPLLHTYFRADIKRLHHKKGFNACVWRLPKHTHAKWVIEHLDVITKQGAAGITARVRVRR